MPFARCTPSKRNESDPGGLGVLKVQFNLLIGDNMKDRACNAVKIIGLVQNWFRAPFPEGWNEPEQIESFGKLVQQVEDLMIKPPNKANSVDDLSDIVLEGVDYQMEYVDSGIIKLIRCR